jgi:hypothetical protein
MKNSISRRLFLGKTAVASAGIAFLSSNSVLHAFSASESPFEGYNPYAEEKTDLRTSGFEGNHVTVVGSVFDKTGNVAIPNASIEVWHLSPNSTKYRHMAKLKTNSSGQYRFITDFPNRESGKLSRIYFKISYKEESYFTEVALNQFGAYISDAHWEKNRQLGEKLFPEKDTFLNHSTVTFNMSI